MVRRVVPTLVLAFTMVAAAWFVLRVPDVGQAFIFFTAGIPSLAAGEAVTTLFAWLVVLVATSAVLSSLGPGVWASRIRRHSTSYASLLLVVGLLLLVVGTVQRSLPSASVCCGSGSANIREAMQLAR